VYSFSDKLALSRKEVEHQSDLMAKLQDRLRSVKCANEPGEEHNAERRSQLSGIK